MALVQNVSQAAGADGISTCCYSFRSFAHETVSAVGCVTQTEPGAPLGGRHKVPITMSCVKVPFPRRSTAFLNTGFTVGTVLAQKVVTTDASLKGWGAMHGARTEAASTQAIIPVSGIWIAANVKEFQPLVVQTILMAGILAVS